MNSDMKPSSGNKSIIILLLTGLILLAVAVTLVYKRGQKKKAEAETAKVEEPAEEVFKAPVPLVDPQKHQPIAAIPKNDTDTKSNTIKTDKPSGSNKNGSTQDSPKANLGPMGTIDPKVLTRFINSRFSSVRTCYEKRLKINSMLQGVVDLRISISASGKVTGVSVNKDGVRDAEMLKCVKNVVRSWKFPKPDGGRVIFDKPFNFKKKS